nr:asparagine synthase (glutamine-hydrolyzing) [Desulfobulbaceae bacterium]
MCGIAGYKINGGINPNTIKPMVSALYHRGPDSSGFYRSGNYCAGMRRLSINDLESGDQPLYNEDKSVVLFYNGEIYNYPQLRRELEAKGHHFRTRSDGEVICHLYSEFGVDLFEKLDGMFAAALWIDNEQKLILARDIPGEKPLYYIPLSETDVVFASEISSMLAYPGWDRSLNQQALWDFPSFLWIPEPATIYSKVKALPRSHLLIAEQQGIHLRPYANRFNQQGIDYDEHAIVEETRRVVTEAIESRLLSDVPVGCFLSSGLDSSIVSTVAAKSLPNVTTFTIGFENLSDPYHGTADESTYAEEYARVLGTTHHTIRVTADDFRRNLIKFCKHGDQPFSVSSGLGILSIAQAAREHDIKVLLTGDGADECFGGYSWYAHLGLDGITPTPVVTDSPVSFQNFGISLEKRLQILASMPPQERAWAWHYYAAEREKQQLYNPEYFETILPSINHFHAFNKAKTWTPEQFIQQDRQFYFPNEMLRKADRMTMACSVEGRVPFAAPSVLAHSDKLRYVDMVKGDTLKWALRKAFAPILPENIFTRPKHGFNVPIDHWLKSDWADLLEDSFAQNSALMKAGLIHKKSRDIAVNMLNDPERLNGHTIFSFIMLNIWLENVHGNNS